MLALDDISALLRDDLRDPRQLTGTIRKQHGHRKDAVSLNETVLNQGCHGNHIHVAAGEYAHNLLVFDVEVFERRDRQKARVLDNHLVVLDHVQERDNQLIVLNRDDAVHVFLNIGEKLFTGTLHRRAVRNGVGARQRHNLSRLERSLHAGRIFRLDTDHVYVRVQQLREGRDTARKAAAADRNQNVIDGRELLHDFHCDAALSGCDRQIVERMHDGRTGLRRTLIGALQRIVEHSAVQHHLGAECLGAINLHERRHLRHADGCLDAGELCREGHTLCVVARGGRDETLFPRFLVHGRNLIICAAHLVSAGLLHVLGL